MIEIERKFLVNSNNFKTQSYNSFKIKQGFLNTHKERTVRVRLKGDIGYITVKGASSKNGLSRFEWEKEITTNEANSLLKLCENGVIDKTRYEVKSGNHIFEIDEFYGENAGLIIAEIELTSENESFEKPNWLGKEVTGEIKYYNSQLSIMPFNKW
ncbi:CYTH domain-containing protein [Lacinutrix sp. MedPE-SW]|uniref:CYTH domain-containing protein n=1 Tax=Lacinutrix sp. MedPE-SW TaxID=1860087 RepID=UPI000916BCF2|nr:CYTH domain-containing protein [Lacinutrix sp. MedPE-SW]OIQ23434.1 MAG: adenylate cyclase [Lacinutrix sp. MedPE-SW]